MLSDAIIKQWFNFFHHRDPGPVEYKKFQSYDFGRFINALVDYAPNVEPFVWPVGGQRIVNVPFGSAAYRRRFGFSHTGADINTHNNGHPTGNDEPILSIGQGVVERTGLDAVSRNGVKRGYGNMVLIRHRHNLKSLYAHLKTISTHGGWAVAKGAAIGTSDSTGFSTGPHLHLELWVKNAWGVWVKTDPLSRLPKPDILHDI